MDEGTKTAAQLLEEKEQEIQKLRQQVEEQGKTIRYYQISLSNLGEQIVTMRVDFIEAQDMVQKLMHKLHKVQLNAVYWKARYGDESNVKTCSDRNCVICRGGDIGGEIGGDNGPNNT